MFKPYSQKILFQEIHSKRCHLFERNEALLLLMLEIVEKIENFNSSIQSLEEFEKDAKVYDAPMMNFIVIGELVLKLSPDFIETQRY